MPLSSRFSLPPLFCIGQTMFCHSLLPSRFLVPYSAAPHSPFPVPYPAAHSYRSSSHSNCISGTPSSAFSYILLKKMVRFFSPKNRGYFHRRNSHLGKTKVYKLKRTFNVSSFFLQTCKPYIAKHAQRGEKTSVCRINPFSIPKPYKF